MAIPRAAIMGVAGLVLVLGAFLMTRNKAATEEPAATPPSAVESSAGAPPASAADSASDVAAGDAPAERSSAPGDRDDAAEVPAAPRDVARALGRKQVVVLLLSQSGAADDEVTRRSVRRIEADRIRGKRKVAVFSDRIHNVGEYRGVIGSLGVSQAPSIVVVPPSLEARLLEGYTDYRSLRQHVADALR